MSTFKFSSSFGESSIPATQPTSYLPVVDQRFIFGVGNSNDFPAISCSGSSEGSSMDSEPPRVSTIQFPIPIINQTVQKIGDAVKEKDKPSFTYNLASPALDISSNTPFKFTHEGQLKNKQGSSDAQKIGDTTGKDRSSLGNTSFTPNVSLPNQIGTTLNLFSNFALVIVSDLRVTDRVEILHFGEFSLKTGIFTDGISEIYQFNLNANVKAVESSADHAIYHQIELLVDGEPKVKSYCTMSRLCCDIEEINCQPVRMSALLSLKLGEKVGVYVASGSIVECPPYCVTRFSAALIVPAH